MEIMMPKIGDAVDLLPPAAADRLRALRQARDDAYVLLSSLTNDAQELRADKYRTEANIKRLLQPGGAGGFNLADDAPQVLAERAKLDKMSKELNRLHELVDVRGAQRTALGSLVLNIERWISANSAAALTSYSGPAPVLRKGEDLVAAIERTRRRQRELAADLHQVRSAPWPAGVAKAKLRKQVDALAEAGRPDVSGLIEHGADAIEWQTVQRQFRVLNADAGATVFAELPELNAFMCWFDKPGMIKRLEAEIDACADDAAALDDGTREKKTAQLLSDLLASERDECAFIDDAKQLGLQIAYRVETDPRAVLGVD